ncbi:MAG: biosynthetic peptidoglycan transglycosylase, partial [Patescibacteria group bacterium]
MVIPRRARLRRLYARQKFTTKLLIVGVGFLLVSFIFLFLTFAWFARDLPAPGKLVQVSNSSTVFYDRDGNVLFEMYKDRNRVPVSLKEVSPFVQKATVAIEDKNFYKHKGISETGIIRSVFAIVFKGTVQGGSTITQQLIKNVLLDSQRTASRKIKEVILAIEVERRYNKDQILELYLNEAPYGGTFWGIGSASRVYFGKP